MPFISTIPFGFPGAIWFALVALPVIAAFFLRYRSQIREIPALTHWLTIGRPIDVRSTGALLRRLLSLGMQMLLIGLLVFCLADPFPRSPETHRVAIVIDVSSTMQTVESGGSRLQLALADARNVLMGLSHDARVYLVTASDRPMSLQGEAMSPQAALKQLNSIGPSDTDGDLPAAIRAVSFLADDSAAKAIVLSDFAGRAAPSELRSFWNGAASLVLIPIGVDHQDAAITSCWAEPEHLGWRVGASFTSRGFGGKIASARLISRGQTIAEKKIVLKDVADRVEFHTDLPADAPYEIVLDAGDHLAVDDHAFGILPSRPVVCLVTDGDAPLVRALRADPDVGLRIVRHAEYGGPRDANVVIVDGPGLPVGVRGKSCGYLFINTADPFGFVKAGLRVAIPGVSHWQGEHPSLAEIDPGNIHVHSVLSLQANGAATLIPLLSSGYVPIISELSTTETDSPPARMVYWAFRLTDTDLTGQLTFPILLWDTIDYLAGHEDNSQQHITGHALIFTDLSNPRVMGPDGQLVTGHPMGSGFEITNIQRQGFYTILTKQREQTVAVNLLSARGTLPLPRDSTVAGSSSAALAGTNASLLNWRMVLIAALILIAMEWFLFHWRILRIG